MTTLPIYQVDAFATRLFEGNPAAVCPLDHWLPDAQMQAIAAENNLSETAFFVPEGRGYRLRWFTPTVEVDLCGHATLASAHVLFAHLGHPEAVIRFETRSGPLDVRQAAGLYEMDFPALPLRPVEPPPALLAALGMQPLYTALGMDYLALLDSEAALVALDPDLEQVAQLPARGLIVTAPGETADFVSRFFVPQSGVPEDPVTGSAHCALAPFWAQRLGKDSLLAHQRSRRGGELRCTLRGDRVVLAGQALTYLAGNIFL
ncbi:MAG: PhzF family phenazine biosynthesis protein [Bacteroidia bacterium]